MIETALAVVAALVSGAVRLAQREGATLPAAVLATLVLVGLDARRGGDWRRHYLSAGFWTDVVWTVFYAAGLYSLLIAAPAYAPLIAFVYGGHGSFLKVHLLDASPAWLQLVLVFLAIDFLRYWVHRASHRLGWLWAFHCVHHSSRHLTPLTSFRYHFVDAFVIGLANFAMRLLLGTPNQVWLPFNAIIVGSLLVVHVGRDWSFGPLGRVLVDPRFHALHHAADPRLRERNFGQVFSFWDDLFGTAERRTPLPERYGAPEAHVPESWLGQVWYPIARGLGRLRARPDDAAAPA